MSEAMELKVDELKLPKKIGFNYDELKNELATRLTKYKTMVYTEESISEAKTDRATLNKLDKALNDRRLELEREYMEPFTDFKNKITELRNMINEPIHIIDVQIKDFEEQQKQEKEKQIREAYDKIVVDDTISKMIKIEQIWNDKWLNKTYKLSTIEEEIATIYDNTKRDIDLIMNMETPHRDALISAYTKTLDIAKVLQEKARLEEQQKQIEELKTKREAEAKAAAERKAAEEAERAEQRRIAQEKAAAETKVDMSQEAVEISRQALQTDNSVPGGMATNIDDTEEKIYNIKFEVRANKDKLMALSQYLKDNKIEYQKVQ